VPTVSDLNPGEDRLPFHRRANPGGQHHVECERVAPILAGEPETGSNIVEAIDTESVCFPSFKPPA